jgi:hypothetical protein
LISKVTRGGIVFVLGEAGIRADHQRDHGSVEGERTLSEMARHLERDLSGVEPLLLPHPRHGIDILALVVRRSRRRLIEVAIEAYSSRGRIGGQPCLETAEGQPGLHARPDSPCPSCSSG